ncbi:MAG: hypothetical protein KME07_15415 [Pegethrix bostrychoides GSE-TBD4-15B]|uniref:Uncharacterized protein n=1 Tax=Pegethrix bostrychoides GSE-TBD4-15B TaxID=2839662 RepID=A0A951PC25_9CYAN|nr:hypothetical protein [Pegethrix bostrychoides GSE-TBD4-15B]
MADEPLITDWVAPAGTLADLIQDLSSGSSDVVRETDPEAFPAAFPEISSGDSLAAFMSDWSDANVSSEPPAEAALSDWLLPEVPEPEITEPEITEPETAESDRSSETDDWADLLELSPDLVIGAEFESGFEPVIPSESDSSIDFDLSSIDFALADPAAQTLADFTADPFDFASLPSADVAEPVAELAEFEPKPELAVESEPELEPAVEPAPVVEPVVESELVEYVVEPVAEPELSEPAALELAELQPVESQPVALLAPDSSTDLDADTFAQLDLLLAEPPAAMPPQGRSAEWAIGIDLGTTGISAVLLNQTTHQLYPIYWQDAAAKKQFRRSTTVIAQRPFTCPTASPLDTLRSDADSTLSLSDWKPYLNLAIPHHSPQTSQWEPVLQWSEAQTLSLRSLQEVLQQLLLSLTQPESLTCRALGLEAAAFQTVLSNLSSVVVGYPSSASDTYSFNLREVILQVGLVSRPEQIVFVEEAIAALLSALPAANGERLTLSNSAQDGSGHLHNADWQGCTLVLTAGASLSELLLVTLPTQLQTLTHTDFYLRGLAYGGEGLDQDTICQLIYPMLAVPSEPDVTSPVQADFETELTIPADLLAGLALPDAADPAPGIRPLLRQRLVDSTAGEHLLNAARALKITLQYQSQCSLRLGDRLLSFERSDLTSRVLLPYVQQLNRDLNALLAQTNTTAAAVNQVICTGGTASLNAVTRWLRQKLPNATIIQDTYARSSLSARFDHGISSCSRIAYGLAALPLHPQVIDESRHRYSDYFLLKALLQVMSPQPQPLEAILTGLEQQGIDTQLCRLRILALLEGYLPPGLVPSPSDLALLTAASAANPDYQAIQLTPLFYKSADKAERSYAANRAQWDYLQRYLETLLADTEQRLNQPLGLNLHENLDIA